MAETGSPLVYYYGVLTLTGSKATTRIQLVQEVCHPQLQAAVRTIPILAVVFIFQKANFQLEGKTTQNDKVVVKN